MINKCVNCNIAKTELTNLKNTKRKIYKPFCSLKCQKEYFDRVPNFWNDYWNSRKD